MDGNTKSSKALTTTSSIKLDPIRDFKQIQEFALAIVDSDTANVFKKPGAEKADVADVIGAISIGLEIGIPPMSAISLGKTLNAKSYLSVLKGKAMGLDPITSISKVHIIPTNNGDVIYTSVDIINKMYLDTNTRLKFIRDYEATPKYYTLNDDNTVSYVGHKWKIYNEDKTVYICTGSQGEVRSALARIAAQEHPRAKFGKNTTVIFSSKTIPGTEKAVERIQNNLYALGVNIITECDAHVHVSGHPYR